MKNTYYSLNKISNLQNNIKYMFNDFSEEEIKIVKNIIQTMFKYSFSNGKIINNKLFDSMNKVIQKFNLKIEKNQIVFINYSVLNHDGNTIKTLSAFLEKIHSYLSKNASDITVFKNVFDLINDDKIKNKIIIKSNIEEKNQVIIAEKRDLFLKDMILNDYLIADNNAIQFKDIEQKNIDNIRNKQIIGNKQDQIEDSKADLSIDIADVKNIIKDIETNQVK